MGQTIAKPQKKFILWEKNEQTQVKLKKARQNNNSTQTIMILLVIIIKFLAQNNFEKC